MMRGSDVNICEHACVCVCVWVEGGCVCVRVRGRVTAHANL